MCCAIYAIVLPYFRFRLWKVEGVIMTKDKVTRRLFLQNSGLVAASGVLATQALSATAQEASADAVVPAVLGGFKAHKTGSGT